MATNKSAVPPGGVLGTVVARTGVMANEPVAAGPCEGMGAPSADDHRRGLSGDGQGGPADDPGLGHRASHREEPALRSCGGSVGADLTDCKTPVKESDGSWRAYVCTDPEAGVEAIVQTI